MWKWLTREKSLKQGSNLGQVLIDMGYINKEQLDEALMKQKIHRGRASPREDLDHHRGQKKKLLMQLPSVTADTKRVALRTMHILHAERG